MLTTGFWYLRGDIMVGIGQDSHAFDFEDKEKPLIIGGVLVKNHAPLKGNSDADVVLHAVTNAISGITCVNILGKIADDMCHNHGIKDSSVYLKEALKYLGMKKIIHISISIECLTPKISPIISSMRQNLASLLLIDESQIGITATTGEGLTAFGQGKGIQCFACITTTD